MKFMGANSQPLPCLLFEKNCIHITPTFIKELPEMFIICDNCSVSHRRYPNILLSISKLVFSSSNGVWIELALLVTVNDCDAVLDPWVAVTLCGPLAEAGTVNAEENDPLLSVVAGLKGVESNFKLTVELESNPFPVAFTDFPTGPEVGSSAIEETTVNGFDAELDPSLAITV